MQYVSTYIYLCLYVHVCVWYVNTLMWRSSGCPVLCSRVFELVDIASPGTGGGSFLSTAATQLEPAS